MATLAQVRAELTLTEKKIASCRVYGDVDGFELACNKRQSLQAQLAIIEEKLRERGTIGEFELDSTPGEIEKRRKRSAVVVGDQVQLPTMSQGKMGFPNVLLRSALFGIWSRDKAGQALLRESIACESGYSILFTGHRLWQKDFLLMAAVLRLAADDLSKPVLISIRQLLKTLGMDDGATNYESLLASLARLHGASIAIQHEQNEVSFDGRLLSYKLFTSEQVRMVELRVDVKWAQLFGIARWTALHFDKLAGLGKKELAIWLAGYLATHDGKRPVTLDRLLKASGVTTERRFFRRGVRAALAECVERGLLLAGELTDADELVFQPPRMSRLCI